MDHVLLLVPRLYFRRLWEGLGFTRVYNGLGFKLGKEMSLHKWGGLLG